MALGEGVGGVAVTLVGQKLTDQLGARIVVRLSALGALALLGGRRRAGEHARLDLHQRRRHHQELARRVDI